MKYHVKQMCKFVHYIFEYSVAIKLVQFWLEILALSIQSPGNHGPLACRQYKKAASTTIVSHAITFVSSV